MDAKEETTLLRPKEWYWWDGGILLSKSPNIKTMACQPTPFPNVPPQK